MNTIDVLQQLIFQNNDLKKVFECFGIISNKNQISVNERPEFKNLLKPFINPKIVAIYGYIEIIALICPIPSDRKYFTLFIQGNECKILKISKNKIVDELFKFISLKDFLPSPLLRKIVFINNYQKYVDGIIFSEIYNNIWTLDNDPLSIKIDTKKRCGAKVILTEVIFSICSKE